MEAARFGAFWRELRTVRSRMCVCDASNTYLYRPPTPETVHTQCLGGQGEWTRRVVSKPARGEGGEEEYVVMLHILALPGAGAGAGAVAAAAAPEPAVGARLAVIGGGMLCWYGGLVHRRNAPKKPSHQPPRSLFISLSTATGGGAASASASASIPESRSPVAASSRHAHTHAQGNGNGNGNSGGEGHGLWVLDIDAAALRDFVSQETSQRSDVCICQ